MPPFLRFYDKKQVEVTSEDWTPLIPEQPCDFFSLRCLMSALLIRTDRDDATTEDTLAAGMQESVTAGSGAKRGTAVFYGQVRFPAGQAVCWLKSVEATATVMVTWVL